MISTIVIAVLILLIAIIDLRFKEIPSILLTGLLFVVIALHPANLYLGILTFTLAYLLFEADFFKGVADIKIMTVIGFMLVSLNYFFLFVISIAILGIGWKAIVKYALNEEEYAFIPVFFFIFIELMLLGGVR